MSVCRRSPGIQRLAVFRARSESGQVCPVGTAGTPQVVWKRPEFNLRFVVVERRAVTDDHQTSIRGLALEAYRTCMCSSGATSL